MAITPGGRVGDDSHFSSSKTSNWVARAGGLPKYILEVAHALIKDGHDESSAIAIAVATMKRWAAGRGNVSPKVQAAAAAALAEWNAKRGASHVKKVHMSDVEFDAIAKSFLGMTDDEITKYDPKQPRDPHTGEWVKVGNGHVLKTAAGNSLIVNSSKGWAHGHKPKGGKSSTTYHKTLVAAKAHAEGLHAGASPAKVTPPAAKKAPAAKKVPAKVPATPKRNKEAASAGNHTVNTNSGKGGNRISLADAAAQMYGEGSKQHGKALIDEARNGKKYTQDLSPKKPAAPKPKPLPSTLKPGTKVVFGNTRNKVYNGKTVTVVEDRGAMVSVELPNGRKVRGPRSVLFLPGSQPAILHEVASSKVSVGNIVTFKDRSGNTVTGRVEQIRANGFAVIHGTNGSYRYTIDPDRLSIADPSSVDEVMPGLPGRRTTEEKSWWRRNTDPQVRADYMAYRKANPDVRRQLSQYERVFGANQRKVNRHREADMHAYEMQFDRNRKVKKNGLSIVTRVMTDREYDDILKNFGEFEDDDFTITGEIIEKNDDKHLVFGWASVGIRKDGTILTDRQGDVIDSPDEIEKSAYDFVLSSRDGGEMHVRKGVSTLVESFVTTVEKTRAMGIPDGVLPIGWWTGWKVHDQGVWDDVKKGKYPMFSVHGRGIRTEYVEGD